MVVTLFKNLLRKFLRLSVGLFLVIPFIGSESVGAAVSDWKISGESRVRLLAAGLGDFDLKLNANTLQMGLEFQLEPGWKIYWRSPGDAGLPPQANWVESTNLHNIVMEWPAPQRFTLFGLETFGYDDHIILPIKAQIIDPTIPIQVHTVLNYLTCQIICVPNQVTLNLMLPPLSEGQVDENANLLIAQFTDQVPRSGQQQGIALQNVVWNPLAAGKKNLLSAEKQTLQSRKGRLDVRVTSLEPLSAPDLLIEAGPHWLFDAPHYKLTEDRLSALLTVTGIAQSIKAPSLIDSEITLTLIDWDGDHPRALEKKIILTAGENIDTEVFDHAASTRSSPSPVKKYWLQLSAILGLALLGGLILNLMPCVLPVLSLKLLSVLEKTGKPARIIRIGFLATSAGILFGFLVLASILIGLRTAGIAIGWGIQFQQPWFLTIMTVILTLFAANLFGLFEIYLPRMIADRLPIGSQNLYPNSDKTEKQLEKYIGHFLTGTFVTLLATPCSAPFLGTAVGFALSRGSIEILMIFTALGLGLASPYLVIACGPKLIRYLPKPGRWMIGLRYFFAVGLLGTGFWLLSILTTQIGLKSALACGLALIALILVLAARRLSSRWRYCGVATLLIVSLLLPFAWAQYPQQYPTKQERFKADAVKDNSASTKKSIAWQTYTAQKLADLQAQEAVILVDVTAEWCLTCLINKELILNRKPVAEQFIKGKIIPLKADWTQPNPEITKLLNQYGRYGIPFNIVYGPSVPNGIVLPELLTTQAVLAAFERASAVPLQ